MYFSKAVCHIVLAVGAFPVSSSLAEVWPAST
jgi:hypothetical protein